MQLETLNFPLTVCKVADVADADAGAGFFFLARTGEEISLVCRTEDAPQRTLAREDGWRAFRVKGSMDFSLVGVLARLSGVLAAQGIPIFAVSTFNTDYVLVKEDDFERALACLAEAGCRTA
ncbi:MAG: ACT domain-containing protein [Desulfovibrio sp.]|nr:ACT domain-containing protein [Desulfovibrio sp.]MBR6467819.1 ACT domain-containing protein [Desulfovibrio sp.]